MDKIIKELHKIYDKFNETKFDNKLLPCIITVQSKGTKKDEVTGWASCEPIWIQQIDNLEQSFYELNIVAEYLDREYEQITETLLHEMVHIYNSQNNIEDTTKKGKHLESFKNLAERVRLLVEEGDKVGYGITYLSPSLIEEIHAMDINKDVFAVYRYMKPKEKNSKPRQPKAKYKCPNCGREVSSKDANLIIQCGECGVDFNFTNKDEIEEFNKPVVQEDI